LIIFVFLVGILSFKNVDLFLKIFYILKRMSLIKHNDKNIEIIYNPDEDSRYMMQSVYNFLNTASRVKTIVDEKKKQIISYYWDHINYVWIKSVYNMPSNFVVVHAPLTYNSSSSWRSFKSFKVLPYNPPLGLSRQREETEFRMVTDE